MCVWNDVAFISVLATELDSCAIFYNRKTDTLSAFDSRRENREYKKNLELNQGQVSSMLIFKVNMTKMSHSNLKQDLLFVFSIDLKSRRIII